LTVWTRVNADGTLYSISRNSFTEANSEDLFHIRVASGVVSTEYMNGATARFSVSDSAELTAFEYESWTYIAVIVGWVEIDTQASEGTV
jgi:hypothetical protein